MEGLKLVPYQACRSAEAWTPVPVPSSDGERMYTVFVSPWAIHESICECKGYLFRGRCQHQDTAARRVCGWSELSNPQQQTPEERKEKICPKCGGSTRWEVECIEE